MSIRTTAIWVAASLTTMALAGAPRCAGADTSESWPRSFFESLFGIPPRGTPRAQRRSRAYRSLPRREGRRRQRHAVTAPSPVQAARPQDAGRLDAAATYRTMCVRLCDGYYWPISFATDQAHFSRDSQKCTRSCGAPVALYYYPNPGGAPEDMVNLKGVPYKSLAKAFLFRTAYDESCKCRPHPWEPQESTQAKGARAAPRQPGQ